MRMKAEDPSLVVLGPVSTPTDPSNLGDGKNFHPGLYQSAARRRDGRSRRRDRLPLVPETGRRSVIRRRLATISQLGDFAASFHAWLSGTTVRADVPIFLTEYNIGLGSPNTPVYVNQLVNGLWVANALGEFIRYFGNGGGTTCGTSWAARSRPTLRNPSAGDLGYLQHNGNTFRLPGTRGLLGRCR